MTGKTSLGRNDKEMRCEYSLAAHFEWDFASAIRAIGELERSLRKGRLAAAAPKRSRKQISPRAALGRNDKEDFAWSK